jgi:hypothetical protein
LALDSLGSRRVGRASPASDASHRTLLLSIR